ncbi:DUF1857 family protein [Marinobacter halodurans]|uniref:DUF1857 family protein n=1 Tax=Marinobacter halodurans TaxID=2528979 RepID=A0ABY1ZP82_9GAMM|nr:AtaL-like protein [Marinobacter halodurans]TBW55752.1 DUF1857 family protein [Marinobacter halodurans]
MQFEHVVQVNDLTDDNIPNITRAQLWDGIALRATEPHRFLIGLDEFDLEWQSKDQLKRRLELPGVVVHDVVTFDEPHSVQYDIIPTVEVAGGSLTMTIEEPEPDALFVRFRYWARYVEDMGEELPYDLFVQQAYIATDIDTIRIIRDRVTLN